MKLWIDDLRDAPGPDWHTARTSEIALTVLQNSRNKASDWLANFEEVSFDHDLGGDDTSRRVLIWMIENDHWPKVVRFHTMNPIGRKWLVGTAQRYAPEGTKVIA